MKKKRADLLVYEQGLVDSREKAKRLIMAGEVYFDQIRVEKPGQHFNEDTEFEIRGKGIKYVSRGGYKIEKAAHTFDLVIKDKVCGDFGASTGGFSDYMLQNHAKRIYAIDVGYNQLAYKIRIDPRVIVYEKTNIRNMSSNLIGEELDLITIDVSFISLELILPKAYENLKDSGRILALIKPQFEAERKDVGKGGIIRDPEVYFRVINKIKKSVEDFDFKMTGLTFSPITGSSGNIEFLSLIEKKGEVIKQPLIHEIIEASKILR